VLGILNTFGPATGSIEGMVYTLFPVAGQITGLPEVVLQSLALAALLVFWVHRSDTRWLNWLLNLSFVVVIVLPILGFIAGQP
jgi:hypothetical protein